MNRILYVLLLLIISLNTFGQLNVDLATGRGSATIPIHTVSEGNLAVPIALNYDASGIQVGANSSRVGLNWSLNTVGQIVRIVRDQPDEGWTEVWGGNGNLPVVHEWNYMTNGNAPLLVPDKKWAAFRDCEPDLFILTLNGQNYPFYMGPKPGSTSSALTPLVVLVKQEQDITIEPIVATDHTYAGTSTMPLENLLIENGKFMGLLGFKVTDTNGVVYYFGETSTAREYAFSYNTYEKSGYLYHSPLLNKLNIALSTSAPYAWKISRIAVPKVASTTNENYQSIAFTYKRTRTVRQQPPALLDKEYALGYSTALSATGQGLLPDSLGNKSGKPDSLGAALQDAAASCQPVPKLRSLLCGSGPNSCDPWTIRFVQLEATLERIDGVSFQIDFNSTALLTRSEPTNLGTIVPDYIAGSFSSVQDKSVLEANQITFPSTLLDGRSNPILALPSTPLLRNIVVTDKKSNKQVGYYLDYDYYNYYFNQTQNRGLFEVSYAQLKLKGLYPLAIQSEGIKLDNGYTFSYHGGVLPEPSSAAKDAWGYANGKDINLNLTGFISTPPPCLATQSDLTPDLEFTKMGSLKSIKLPTGGLTSFVYELHDGNYFEGVNADNDTINFKSIGGLRVKQLVTTDPLRQNVYKTNYTYKISDLPGSRSSGFLSIWPDQFTFFNSDQAFLVVPSQFAFLANRFINGNYITYSRVKEEQVALVGGSETSNGYIKYDFTIGESTPYLKQSWFPYGFYSKYSYEGTLPDFSYLKGTPQAIRVYTKDGLIQQETFFNYKVVDKKATIGLPAGVKLIPLRIRVDGNEVVASAMQTYSSGLNGMFILQAGPIASVLYLASIIVLSDLFTGAPNDQTDYSKLRSYTTPAGFVYLADKKDVSYAADGTTTLATSTFYKYDGTTHHQPTKIVSDYVSANNPDGNTHSKQEVRIIYNTDYDLASSSTKNDELKGIEALNARKILIPVESVSIKNERVVAASYTQFYGDTTALNTYGMPKAVLRAELDAPVPLSAFVFSAVGSGVMTKSGLYKPQTEIISYNSNGLMTASRDSDNPNAISTLTYDSNGLLPLTSTLTTPSNKAYTTSYEYETPLFGISKVSNPDGSFSTKEYDALGRQTLTRDLNNNIIKTVTYTSVGTPAANDQIAIQLQAISNPGAGPTKPLVNGTSVTNAEIQAIKQQTTKITILATPTTTFGSVVYDLKGPSATVDPVPVNKQTTTQNSTTNIAFDQRYGNGFTPIAGSYTLTAKAYSQENGEGVLLSQKTIQFTIQP